MVQLDFKILHSTYKNVLKEQLALIDKFEDHNINNLKQT